MTSDQRIQQLESALQKAVNELNRILLNAGLPATADGIAEYSLLKELNQTLIYNENRK